MRKSLDHWHLGTLGLLYLSHWSCHFGAKYKHIYKWSMQWKATTILPLYAKYNCPLADCTLNSSSIETIFTWMSESCHWWWRWWWWWWWWWQWWQFERANDEISPDPPSVKSIPDNADSDVDGDKNNHKMMILMMMMNWWWWWWWWRWWQFQRANDEISRDPPNVSSALVTGVACHS